MELCGGREQSRPLMAEDEALKRNTDCVYFLASPLTCKKGTECEYRHSEGARVNPRDCWYWLNGNCLNPKCTFRHPPLDGLIGMLGTASELAPPPTQTVALTHDPAAHGPAGFNLNKQNVPCYYFQKGHCLKGDRCPFMHGPQQRDNPVPQQYTSPPDPVSPLKKESWCLRERTSQQSIHKADFDKPVVVPLAPVKPAGKSENVLNNGFAIKETASPYPSEDGLPRFQQSNVPDRSGIALGWPRSQQSQPLDDYLQNAREADEFLRESSPGFDVLVNNNMEDSEYFHDEGDFERVPVQDARNLNNVSDFEFCHSDYESVPNFERDHYNVVGVHDRYGRLDNWYGREQQRTTSETILKRAMHEKRMLQGEESHHDIDGSDLRHRLLKQRRLNGSKSTFSPDHCGKLYQRHNYFVDEERSHADHACRGPLHFPMEMSKSSRLQGRITLPARSSPDRPIDLQSERNRDKGRCQERSSPARPVNYKGRHHDKIKRRPVFSDVRNAGVQPIRREEVDPLDFAGPKSLAELKGAKLSENLQDQKEMKLRKPLGHQESDGFLSFEGPKPLSVILKRKRENAPGNDANFCNGDKNTQRDDVGGIGSSVLAATEREDDYTANCSKFSKVAGVGEKEVGIFPMEGEELPNDDQTSAGGNTHEVEHGMIAGATDGQEPENYGQRAGESDYEEVEAEEFRPEDDENTCQEDEEDDEDDFAKKVGVMFS